VLAFLLASLVSGGGIYLLAQGQDVTGLVALLTPLVGLASLFVSASRQRDQKALKKTDDP